MAAPSVLSTLSPEPLTQKRVGREAEELDVAIARPRRLLEHSRAEEPGSARLPAWQATPPAAAVVSGELLEEPLESGCWSRASGCKSPCPCSHLRGTGVGRTACFFPVGQPWWVGQRKGGLCSHCQHACNREGKGNSRDVEPNQKTLFLSPRSAESSLRKGEV